MHLPVGGVGGHDVEVTVDEQGRAGGVGPLDPGGDAGPAGMGLVDLGVQPHLCEQRGNMFCCVTLPWA